MSNRIISAVGPWSKSLVGDWEFLATVLAGAFGISASRCQAQLFVLELGGGTNGAVAEYTTSGALINPSLFSDIPWAQDLAVNNDGNLLVLSFYDPVHGGFVGEYTRSGVAVNPALILGGGGGIALDGNGHIFISRSFPSPSGSLGEYTSSGGVVASSLITGLDSPQGVACDSTGDIFIAGRSSGAVAKYSTSGAVLSPNFITGLYPSIWGVVYDGNGHLFISQDNGVIGKYDAVTGAALNASVVLQ